MQTNKRTTQKEIAKKANISPDFLSHIIHGRRRCPPSAAKRLEDVTGICRKILVWGSPSEIQQAIREACGK